MKKLYFSVFAAFCAITASASGQWTLQDKVYTVDTLFHAKVGPGTTQTSLKLSGPSNLRVFYTVTDLTNPNVEMRVVKAGDKLAACATVSSMAKSKSVEGAQYFAGVNADFFGNQQPIGTTVVDSEIYYASNNGWTHWAIDADKRPYLGQMSVSGTVSRDADGSSHSLTAVNAYRGEDNLIIFTPRYGTTSGTNAYGAEAVIVPVDNAIAPGKDVKVKVVGTPETAGSMTIPAGGYVLSGHGTAKTFVNALSDGDILTVSTSIKLGDTPIVPTQVAGGQPMILSEGTVLETQSALDHLGSLNPRTAIGHDATGTKLVMLVVDGRTTTSVGVVSKVLADMMRETGCTEAMNFDGGGSSALYIQALGVRNDPSDGNERAVTDAVYAVATTPDDDNITEIAFVDNVMTLPKYGYYTPVIYGYNKYGVLVSTDVKGVTLSCPEALGQVVNDGATLFANGSGCHALTATYGEATASIAVTIGTAEPKFRLSKVLVDSYTDYSVEVTAIVGDIEMPLDNGALTWTSDDPEIATVDETGKIHGLKNGSTVVRGAVESFSGEITVNVEIPESRYMAVDSNIDVTTWTVGKSGVTGQSISALGSDGFALDCTISNARNAYIRALKDIELYSLPDSLSMAVNPGSTKVSKIQVAVKNAAGRTIWTSYDVDLTADTENNLRFSFADMVDVTDMGSYPILLTGIMFNLSGSAGDVCHIEVPRLESVYTAVPAEVGGVADIVADNGNHGLTLNPNPVNAGEAVVMNVSGQAVYGIYSISGSLINQAVGNVIFTEGLSAGVYVVSVSDNNVTRSARLVIK